MKLKAPERVTWTQSGFCPGCGHGIAFRLIAEVMEELGLSDKLLLTVDVACCSLAIECVKYDTIMCAHGRGVATAIGAKKVRPENPVCAYLGDGAAYSIGMAETIHTGLRNDNVVVITVNNSLYGMTGGQMAPTTLPGQKTTSSKYGKDPERFGMPFNIVDAYQGFKIGYLARGALCDVANINKAKSYIKKAFEKHMNGDGLCYVELLSACPTNLNMQPVKAMQRIKEEMVPYFPLGEFQDNTKEKKEEE
ncbi:MAG: 2-oxoglutarate oxidoreductase [Mogibacterium sp.]|nr:2-oxoglutarate oxidoreductase [Mogibacterium sp.]